MSGCIANQDLQMCDVPKPDAPMGEIFEFALTFNGYENGGFSECAEIANKRLQGSLTEVRTCLFFEHRRFRHFGEMPEGEEAAYIRSLVCKIAEYLPHDNHKRETPDFN